MADSFIDTLCTHFKAGTPVLAVNTDETNRVVNEIKRAAWKTGDGIKVKLTRDEYLTYRTIFASHSPKDFKDLFEGDDPDNVALVYNSEHLYQIMLAINRCLVDPGHNHQDLEIKLGLVEKLLNTTYTVLSWNIHDGFSVGGKGAGCLATALNLTQADMTIDNDIPLNCVFVFRDAHPWLNTEADPQYREMLRNLVEKESLGAPKIPGQEAVNHHIVFVSPDWQPHRDIQSCLTSVDFALPDEKHLDLEVTSLEQRIQDISKNLCPPSLRGELCRAMRGFTQTEAANAMSFCISRHGGWAPDMIKTIINLQKATFSKTGVLTLIDYDDLPPIEQVGGFENYFEFIDEAMLAYTPEAGILDMPKAKGALLLGVPGTGKSLVLMATARKMKLPLLIYDFGAQFGSLVGQTEATQRQVIKQIMAKGPCVLGLDEFDKVAAGSVGGHQGDSGVNQRSMGRLLSWMANENKEAFVIMTMNRTLGVPPEMLRAGRLDAVFYTTFPSPRERLDILGIHLKKNGGNPALLGKSKLDELVRVTDKYVGAELEQLVKKAVRVAVKERFGELQEFLNKYSATDELGSETWAPETTQAFLEFKTKLLTPTFEMLLAAKKVVTPIVKLDQESVDAIERFCKDTATPVSKEEAESKVFKVGRNIRIGPSNN